MYALPAQLAAPLRNEAEFAFLVTLSRIVSAMLFGIDALNQYAAKATDPPRSDAERLMANARGERQVFEAFLYLTSALHSAIDCLDNAAPQLGHLASFQAVRASLESPQMDEDAVELMQVVRNRAGFHFDPSIAGRVVPTMPHADVVFCVGEGATYGSIHYTTAWLVTMDFIFGGGKKVKDPAATRVRFEKLIAAVHDVGSNFIRVATDQIMERLHAKGFRVVNILPDEEFASITAKMR
jgi:hypothetical protein